MMFGSFASAVLPGLMLRLMKPGSAALWQLLAAGAAVIVALSVAALVLAGLLMIFGGGGYIADVLLVGAVAAVLPGALLTGAAFSLAAVRTILGTTRVGLQSIADAASRPSTSPFTYGAALLGVLILLGKAADELLR